MAHGGSGFSVAGLGIAAVALAAASGAAEAQSAPLPYVASRDALRQTPTTLGAAVMRLDFAPALGAPPLVYAASPAPCALNSGAGDGGAQVASSDGKCWIAHFSDVREWGAACDAAHDDSAAINAALRLALVVAIPGSACRAASTIVVPPGAGIAGAAFNTQEPPSGSQILCDLAVTPCVDLFAPTSGSSSLGGQIISDLTIARAAGDIPRGTICLLDRTFSATMQNVNCDGHDIAYETLNVGLYGIVAISRGLHSCNISGSDVVQNGFAEWHIEESRFGCNATRTKAQGNYVLIEGGPNGPNTLTIGDTQFNAVPNPQCFINWSRLTGAPPIMSEFRFFDNHMEFTGGPGLDHSVFCTDASATTVQNVSFANNTILDNNGASTVWRLDPATTLADWKFSGNQWQGFGKNGWTLSPGKPMYGVTAVGEVYNPPRVAVTGLPGSSVTFSGDVFDGGLTVAGSFAPGSGHFSGVLAGGDVANLAASPVEIDIPSHGETDASDKLTLSFGGAPAALSARSAKWRLTNSTIAYSFFFAILDPGPGSGPAVISGLPFANAGANPIPAALISCTKMKSLASPVLGAASALATTAALYQSGASGLSSLTAANFSAGATCQGQLVYQIQ
jgi:hypothetical protein